MIKGKNIKISSGDNSIKVTFNDYVCDIIINGKERMTVSYNPNLNLDAVVQKLTDALVKEVRRPSFYKNIFPAFGREFKMLVADILKARA